MVKTSGVGLRVELRVVGSGWPNEVAPTDRTDRLVVMGTRLTPKVRGSSTHSHSQQHKARMHSTAAVPTHDPITHSHTQLAFPTSLITHATPSSRRFASKAQPKDPRPSSFLTWYRSMSPGACLPKHRGEECISKYSDQIRLR